MKIIGDFLSEQRIDQDIDFDLLSYELKIDPHDLWFAELGILEPDKFFNLLNSWGPRLGYERERLFQAADEVNQGLWDEPNDDVQND